MLDSSLEVIEIAFYDLPHSLLHELSLALSWHAHFVSAYTEADVRHMLPKNIADQTITSALEPTPVMVAAP